MDGFLLIKGVSLAHRVCVCWGLCVFVDEYILVMVGEERVEMALLLREGAAVAAEGAAKVEAAVVVARDGRAQESVKADGAALEAAEGAEVRVNGGENRAGEGGGDAPKIQQARGAGFIPLVAREAAVVNDGERLDAELLHAMHVLGKDKARENARAAAGAAVAASEEGGGPLPRVVFGEQSLLLDALHILDGRECACVFIYTLA